MGLSTLPLPRSKVLRMSMQDTIADETHDDDGDPIHEKPKADSPCLFLPCVEHGRDDHEPRSNSSLKHAVPMS
jgi:hypothetical protein